MQLSKENRHFVHLYDAFSSHFHVSQPLRAENEKKTRESARKKNFFFSARVVEPLLEENEEVGRFQKIREA